MHPEVGHQCSMAPLQLMRLSFPLLHLAAFAVGFLCFALETPALLGSLLGDLDELLGGLLGLAPLATPANLLCGLLHGLLVLL